MKILRLFILLLIGLSWTTTLAEGVYCEETDRHPSEWIDSSDAQPHEAGHACHAGSCHFGHCGHLVLRLLAGALDQPLGIHSKGRTPYRFALQSGALFLLMRPPLAV